jgi:hypothetical protein
MHLKIKHHEQQYPTLSSRRTSSGHFEGVLRNYVLDCYSVGITLIVKVCDWVDLALEQVEKVFWIELEMVMVQVLPLLWFLYLSFLTFWGVRLRKMMTKTKTTQTTH